MQSSIAMRPRSFDEMIGQDKITSRLRGVYLKKKFPHALMFTGKKGSGKTSFARLVAISLQCTHQEEFGVPCKKCRSEDNLPIYELDCGKVRQVEKLEAFVEKSEYEVVGNGRRKVFIFDEAHRLSGTAQDSLLKAFEDDKHCTWIICSTRANKIEETLRSRCHQYPLKPFNREDIWKYVRRILRKNKSNLSIDELTDALVDHGVDSGRLVAHAVDEYMGGASADDAAQVEGTTEVDSKSLTRAVVKGDWRDVSSILRKTQEGDIRLLRASVVNYLRTVLLESVELNDRSKAIAHSIKNLVYVTQAEDSVMLAALSAELFMLCNVFSEYKL